MIIRTTIDCIACMVEIILSLYFFSAFKERRVSKKTMMIFVSSLFIVYVLILELISVDYILFIYSIAITIALAFCYKFKWYESIFFGLIISVISGLSELVVMQIVTFNEIEFSITNNNIHAYLGGLISAKMLTFTLIVIIRKKSHRSFQSVKGMRFGELLLLPIATALISIVSSHIMFIIGITNFWKVIYVIALLFLIVSNVMTFYIIDTQYELISTKEKLKANKVLLENQKQYYNDIFQSQQEIRRVRHDLKSIFIAILNELNLGNKNEAVNMIQRELSELEQNIDFSGKTDNVIDAVIHSKILYAKNKQIVLCVKKNIDQPIKVDHLDLAILISNILDNSIEAASQVSGERKIFFSIITDNDNLIILCKNPTINKIISNENLSSTKMNKKDHGFGILSIQTISKKYSGSYLYDCDNGIFSSTTILHNMQLGI